MSQQTRARVASQPSKSAPKWKVRTQALLIAQLEALSIGEGLNSKIKRTYARA